MPQERIEISPKSCGLPVTRMVAGSLYKPTTTNWEGKPLLIKTGPNAGQSTQRFFFAIAVPKEPGGQHWAYTPWGKKIWDAGNAAFPQAAQRPDFAWKIVDGDSTIPNKRNRRPCDIEGFAGNWIINLSSSFAPKIYKIENGGYVEVTQEDFIKPGYFIEVVFNVDGNGQQGNPGVYLNHQMVCFRAYGPEISFGPDVTEAGFGAAPLPAGATLVPPVSTLPPSAPAQQQLPPVPVAPNPGFVQLPPPNPTYAGSAGSHLPPQSAPTAPSGAIAMPVSSSNAPPPPSAGPKMTAKAGGVTYQAYQQAGWSDAQLIAEGLMTV
jgi:hypothetical protein